MASTNMSSVGIFETGTPLVSDEIGTSGKRFATTVVSCLCGTAAPREIILWLRSEDETGKQAAPRFDCLVPGRRWIRPTARDDLQE
jgi:hypothetical protein